MLESVWILGQSMWIGLEMHQLVAFFGLKSYGYGHKLVASGDVIHSRGSRSSTLRKPLERPQFYLSGTVQVHY
jgi:hypothetical protein